MEVVDIWTGRHASALQRALRLTNERFAEELGTAVRTVAKWNANPELEPTADMQAVLDVVLERASDPARARFAILSQAATRAAGPDPVDIAAAERRLNEDLHVRAACRWLDGAAGWAPGTARRRAAENAVRISPVALHDQVALRARVEQRDIALALIDYYRDGYGGRGVYAATVDGGEPVRTSILTSPDWLDLAAPLDTRGDGMRLDTSGRTSAEAVNDVVSGAAVRRLAEVALLGSRLVDAPLYRLLGGTFERGRVAGAFGLTTFVDYALTMDLLEGELVDALAAGERPLRGALPLREALLPDASSVADVGNRLCCGGALALCAIARSAADSGRDADDYVLLVQERSGRVLNASGRLAVIPKSFHGPLADFSGDARIGATLRRELEEELFGRDDVDSTVNGPRAADPMHASRLSVPMRWLVERADSDAWQMECTGFGLNLVSGNFEFAGIIAVHDPQFWHLHGGAIAANWESAGLRQYSTRNRSELAELARDRAWSNEGLFALLQGLRRLDELGAAARVDLPTIEGEISS